MKTTWKIAQAELKSLFSSPIAWLILIIFTFQAGLGMSDKLSDEIRHIALYGRGYNLTGAILAREVGSVFSDMLENLYLYIPLLTMGLMSKEYSSGSIKLLYSSPITNAQIIFGKYASMLVYSAVLMLVLLVFLFFGAGVIENFDYPRAFTALLGIFFLTCAYAAIGLFMSTLTAYQVVAAVGTLTALALLNYVQNVGQNYDFVRDITYWLSLAGRSKQFLEGMICSEDILYFFIVIGLFLSLSILKLRFGRTTVRGVKRVSAYGCVIVITLMLGYLTSRPTMIAYYDTTDTKQNTLTPPSQEVVEKFKGDLSITTYVNLLDENYSTGLPAYRKWDMTLFDKYIRFKPDIKMRYVYYWHHTSNPSLYGYNPGLTDEQLAKKVCEAQDLSYSMFMTDKEIEKIIDLSDEYWHFVRIIETGDGKTARLRMYNDNQRSPGETEITAALKQMVMKTPKVAFLTGHGERDIYKGGDREFGAFAINLTFRHSLVNQGYKVITVNLEENDIPEDVDIIVLADPRKDYNEVATERFNKFIAKGGNAFIMSDVAHQAFINPLVEPLGVSFEQGVLVQPSPNYPANMLILDPSQSAMKRSREYYVQFRMDKKFIFPGAVAITKNEKATTFNDSILFATPAKGAWNEFQTTDFIEHKPTLDPATEKEDSIPVAIRLTRKVGDKEQRILLFGDADCIGNGELTTSRLDLSSGNFSIITESFSDLSYGQLPINTERPRPKDSTLRIDQSADIWLKIIFMGVFPGSLLIAYFILWWKRRRK